MEYSARVVLRGRFGRRDITVKREELPPLPPEIAERVERRWAKELERNPKLWSGPLLCARWLTLVGSKLELACGLSEYKNFMGTTESRDIPEKHRHLAVGIMAVLTTADNCVMLGVRSGRVDFGETRHVVPAGRMSPQEQDPFTAIAAEFKEELGLLPSDLRDLYCAGVVADLTWGRLNYEFVFRAKTEMTAFEVIELAKGAKSADEHCQLEPFPWSSTFMRHLLLADPTGYVPTGFAGLALCLQDEFGEKAFPPWEPVHRTYEEHMGPHRLKMLSR